MRAINASLAINKDKHQSLNKVYKNLPEEGDHWRTPKYRVSINTGFVRVFDNIYNKVFHYGSFTNYAFNSGEAQEHHQKYLENETKANAADDVRIRYLKAHIGRLNGLVRDFIVLQNRINSLILSAESAEGVFSYGPTTIAGLKNIVSEIEELKKDVQSGKKYIWQWRSGGGSIDSTLETIKEMESNKKPRESSIDQLKKDYALALKTHENEQKQLKLEEQKRVEEKKAIAEKEKAQALQKQKAEEEAWKQEEALHKAEKQDAAEKIRLELEQRTKAFNVPFGESPEPSKKVTPTTPTVTPKTVTPPTKPISPPAQPTVQTKSTPPYIYDFIPSEHEEIVGFSFIAQGKADMMVSDFFWTPNTLHTVNGALDLGLKDMGFQGKEYKAGIDDVVSIPTSGYDNQDSDPQPEVGHVYAIKTRDGKYGIIQIKFIQTGLETGNRLHFYWRYQPNGSTSF